MFFPQVGNLDTEYLSPVFNYNEWTLLEVEWLSPVHLSKLSPKAPIRISLVKKGEPKSVMVAATEKAFWQLPEYYLNAILSQEGMSTVGSLMEKLTRLIVKFLGPKTDEELLAILSARLFPPVVWDSSWVDDPNILNEVDQETLKALQDTCVVS